MDSRSWPHLIGSTALVAAASQWNLAVNKHVLQPYLDEVFHIRQAQHYCHGRFEIWDPKITTPPGLYILSYILSPILGCSISSLRAINLLCLVALNLVLINTHMLRRGINNGDGPISRTLAVHSALNTVLFPPLFFFSALYYTDIPSTLSVFVFLWYYVTALQVREFSLGRTLLQVALGLISLTFRQTNIFWVAVAPAGLSAVIALDRGSTVVKQSMYRRAEGFGDTTLSIIKTSWKYETIYDPPIRDAWLEDYVRTAVSVAVCAAKALTQPARVLALMNVLAPSLMIMASFAAFILWNGSVVLGDKDNHIATINMPQMLYYWPFVAFFSWPLLLPYMLLIPLTLASKIGSTAHLEPLLFFNRRHFLPRVRILVGFIAIACAVVHFNTIVHPFMLADNRHYVFYVFKRLLRPWWVRYAVTPVYALCAWACVESWAGPPSSTVAARPDGEVTEKQARSTTPAVPPISDQGGTSQFLYVPDGTLTVRTPFVIISLATTSLQLCTAPLVEPRYFIVPWIIWRIHLSLRTAEEPRVANEGKPRARTWATFLAAYDYRVVLETLWLLAINAATGYIFLNWTFAWPSDPGAKMRFMW